MAERSIKLRFRIMFFVFTCITILFADLTIALINKYVLSYRGEMGRHYITLVGMAAVLIIFYLFMGYINRISKMFVNRFVHITRVYLGRQIGLYLSVLILLFLLFAGYYWTWFGTNLFSEIGSAILSVLSEIRSLLNI